MYSLERFPDPRQDLTERPDHPLCAATGPEISLIAECSLPAPNPGHLLSEPCQSVPAASVSRCVHHHPETAQGTPPSVIRRLKASFGEIPLWYLIKGERMQPPVMVFSHQDNYWKRWPLQELFYPPAGDLLRKPSFFSGHQEYGVLYSAYVYFVPNSKTVKAILD